jgi:uncharacterized protein (UPF0333 family)
MGIIALLVVLLLLGGVIMYFAHKKATSLFTNSDGSSALAFDSPQRKQTRNVVKSIYAPMLPKET